MRVGDDAASAATVRQLDACCLDWHDGATHAGTGDVRTKCGLAVKSQCSCYGSCVERYFRRRCVPANQVPQCIVGYCRRELVSAGPISSAACFRRGSRVVLQAGYLLTGFCKSYSGGGDFLSARESYEHLRIVSEKDERIISKRELNILSMYTKGLTTEEIGKYLNISCGTALSHVHHASKKLGVSKRIEAIRFCQQHHLIQE